MLLFDLMHLTRQCIGGFKNECCIAVRYINCIYHYGNYKVRRLQYDYRLYSLLIWIGAYCGWLYSYFGSDHCVLHEHIRNYILKGGDTMLYEIYMLIFHYDWIKDTMIDIANQVFQLLSKL